jgi:CBS domain-containing protein
MSRTTPIRDAMTKDVLTFSPDEPVSTAIKALAERGVDAGPVVDGDGRVLGMLSTGDLIVQEIQLHGPTVISMFGAYLELPSSHRHYEEELKKALGSTVEDLMSSKPVVGEEEDTLELAATLMHEHDISRLPVVRDGVLVGIVSRGDILRAMATPPEAG